MFMFIAAEMVPAVVVRGAACVLCVLAGSLAGVLFAAARYALTQRMGIVEQLGGVYGSIREERMILRAGGYEATALQTGIQFLVLWCEWKIVTAILRQSGAWIDRVEVRQESLEQLMVELDGVGPANLTNSGFSFGERRCDLCRPLAAGPPGRPPSRRPVDNSPELQPMPG